MTGRNLFHSPHHCFTDVQLPPLEVAAPYVGMTVLLDVITGDPFRSRALPYMRQRATQGTAVRQVIADRSSLRHIRASEVASATLTDTEVRTIPSRIDFRALKKGTAP